LSLVGWDLGVDRVEIDALRALLATTSVIAPLRPSSFGRAIDRGEVAASIGRGTSREAALAGTDATRRRTGV
jgi:hypothetical protein